MKIADFLLETHKDKLTALVNFWKFHVLSGATPINEAKALELFKELYSVDDNTEFIFAKSPLEVQTLCNKKSTVKYAAMPLFTDIKEAFSIDEIASEISDMLLIIDDVKKKILTEITKGSKQREFIAGRRKQFYGNSTLDIDSILFDLSNTYNVDATYKEMNFTDYSTIIALQFVQEIGLTKGNKMVDSYIEFAKTGVYATTSLADGKVIFCPLPKVLLDETGKISSSKGLAISFPDNWGMAFWNELRLPNKYVTEPITKEFIMNERNAELKRCLKEMIGNDRFVALLDLVMISEDFDRQGHIMRLMKSKQKDPAIVIPEWGNENKVDGYLYFLNCYCPSTKREYYISVKPTTDVWDAKRSLFNHRPIKYRHGDVGLELIPTETKRRVGFYDFPVFES